MAAEAETLQFGKVTIMQNNESRTQYTPTIKLLKRDPVDNMNSQAGMGDRKPSIKPLQQREAEYAEARKRILGDNSETSSEPVEIFGSETSPKLAQRLVAASSMIDLLFVHNVCYEICRNFC